tara:strand:+ start:1599 stop:1793 length:195 start_codon:yes stop_codon:yes gene_type:complete
LIRVGYTNVDGSDVVHETVDNGCDADLSMIALVSEKSGDNTIEYFFLEMQSTESAWGKYAFIDN